MAKICICLGFKNKKSHALHPQGTCTDINSNENPFSTVKIVGLDKSNTGSPNNAARTSWSTEQGRRDSFTGVLFFGLCVLRAELILFPGLWVKVKLHGLCKVHNSSTNKARLFSFEKTIKSGHWVPEESLGYKQLDGFACFLVPFTALKITAGFILYLIYISLGEPMVRLASQLNFKNKYLPCITFLFKFLCKYKKHFFYNVDYFQVWKQFGSSLSFFLSFFN